MKHLVGRDSVERGANTVLNSDAAGSLDSARDDLVCVQQKLRMRTPR